MAKKKTTRKTSRTKNRSITEMRKLVNSPAETGDPNFRVFRWDQALRDALKEHRETMGLTNQALIRDAVAKQLPQLIQELAQLGISVEDRATVSPCRVPMETATLKALRMASSWTDLPQNLLLQACLRLATRRK
ncbi:hypothetical protein Pan258_45720 [Symmachiella dynata]|uniref:hypothetical protein n=1 Tax=Symmachiella dynata TaxID=2527995 RepID=UPI001189648C|nr:hypothetical protein [Symmachiella dynata]QDT50494.1 hypothetical protein Pan258_45720 [Symmachiella dynata]